MHAPKIGATSTVDFTEIKDTIEEDNLNSNLCGPRTYSILDADNSNNVHSWVTVAAKTGVADTYTITAAPTADSLAGTTKNAKLHVVLADYTA